MERTQQGTKEFTKGEKLSILAEVENNEVAVTLANYGLSATTYNYWKRKLGFGREDILNHSKHQQLESENKIRMKENETLKILLVEKELGSRLKDGPVKKNPDLKQNM
jgi:hypothetical protein